jgi:RNA recognition motif-containing protein
MTTLYVRDLPVDLPEPEVGRVFESCRGYLSARVRKNRARHLVAFIEFEDADAAREAMDRMQTFRFAADHPPIRT